MLCKFCHLERNLIKAHVIPRSFFEIDPAEPPRLATNRDGTFPKRAPTGIYDAQLVCEPCERLFSPYDDYAQQFLVANREAASQVLYEQQVIAYNYGIYDYHKLKLFFISLLWRASESSHVFYRLMELGPHEPKIRQAIIDSDAGNADFYSIVLAKFPKTYGILDPHTTRFDGVKFYQIYLAEYVAYIKVDKRPLPESFQSLELNYDRSLVVLARDPANSKDTQVMRSIVLKNQKLMKRN